MLEMIGGPDRDRTGDLFHAMEARSQLRHRPTLRKDFSYSQTFGSDSQTAALWRVTFWGTCKDEDCGKNEL
jgi:hypothetical protein